MDAIVGGMLFLLLCWLCGLSIGTLIAIVSTILVEDFATMFKNMKRKLLK